MKKTLLVLLATMMLGGCATTGQWTKQNFKNEEWRKDKYECDYNANLYCYRTDGVFFVLCYTNHINSCLKARGYEYVKDENSGDRQDVQKAHQFVEEMIAIYKQEMKPDDAEAHCTLGVAYDSIGRYQEAMESYKQAIRIKPDHARAHYGLGRAYYDLGRYQEAIDALKQAIRIKPSDAEAHYGLGVAYLAVGDKGSALNEYKILKTLDQDLANMLFNKIYK